MRKAAVFDIDSVVRGGRRRRRRRAAAQFAAGIAVLAGIGGAVILSPGQHDAPAPPPAASAPAPSVTPAPVIASDQALTYKQSDKTVTITRKGSPVATVTLTDTTYTNSSARIVFTITAQRPLVMDTDRFILYDADNGENSVATPRTTRFDPGTQQLTLDFTSRAQPAAVGWVPQDGKEASGLWERS